MIPLIVARASVFEQTLLLATAAVGVCGVALPRPISGALQAALGEPMSSIYFGLTMIVPGLLGWLAVRHSQRMRTPDQIEHECRPETWALAAMALAWGGFTVAAALAGSQAIAVTILAGSVSLSCLLRVRQIRRDLRKMHAELARGPKPVDPPPMAEGE